jgi:hypothetical protein
MSLITRAPLSLPVTKDAVGDQVLQLQILSMNDIKKVKINSADKKNRHHHGLCRQIPQWAEHAIRKS